MSGGRTTCDTAGAEWLAGQMSRDTPRLPHATAREYASTGQYRTTVRGPTTLTGTGSPSKTQHHRSRPLTRPRGALLPPEASRADRTAAHVRIEPGPAPAPEAGRRRRLARHAPGPPPPIRKTVFGPERGDDHVTRACDAIERESGERRGRFRAQARAREGRRAEDARHRSRGVASPFPLPASGQTTPATPRGNCRKPRLRPPAGAGRRGGPCPGSGGANPVAAEPIRRRTRPSRPSGPYAGQTGRCAGRPLPRDRS